MSFTLEYFYGKTAEKYKLSLLTSPDTLKKEITWVQLLEDINNCSFIRGGELIVTTGFTTGDGEDLKQLVMCASRYGACGVILNTGNYIVAIDEALIKWCNANNLALLMMPWEIHIADLMEEYCNGIVSEKRTYQQRCIALSKLISGQGDMEPEVFLNPEYPCYMLASYEEIKVTGYAHVKQGAVNYYLCTARIRNCDKMAGISNEIQNFKQILKAVRQAYLALKTAEIKKVQVMEYAHIGLYSVALSVTDEDIFAQAEEMLAPLSNQELRKTFRLYLECQGSVQAVAEKLYLHRNTVNNRIFQIKKLISLPDAEKRLEYLMAFYLCDVKSVYH